MKPRPRLSLLLTLAAVLIPSGTARAGEACYLLLFASQRVPNDPDYSHTFATFVRLTWAGDCPRPADAAFEAVTISWLPETGVVRTVARDPERGRNFGLAETICLALKNQERVTLWGPFPVEPRLYCAARKQVAALESGCIQYKANDAGYRSDQVSNCIHAVSAVVDGSRVRLGSPGWGELASFTVLQRMRPSILDETPDYHVSAALGLNEYPIIYRDRLVGPHTGILGRIGNGLFGPERNLSSTYGPPR